MCVSENASWPLALMIHGDAAFTGQGISLENVRGLTDIVSRYSVIIHEYYTLLHTYSDVAKSIS